MANIVEEKNLLDVSKLEQDLVCSENHREQVEKLKLKISDPSSSNEDVLRLLLLYAIKYEKRPQNQLKVLRQLALQSKNQDTSLVDALLGYAGESHRHNDLFGERKSIIEKSLKMATKVRFLKLCKVPNVFRR